MGEPQVKKVEVIEMMLKQRESSWVFDLVSSSSAMKLGKGRTEKISRTDIATMPSKAPHPTPCKVLASMNCRYDPVRFIFHTTPAAIKMTAPRWIALFPMAWLNTPLARLDTAAAPKGTAVRAAAAVYDTLYLLAMALFVITSNVFSTPAAAVDASSETKAESFLHADQFCVR
jgi:hypothetical protein